MRPKSLILIVIALGCGLVASIGISQVLERKTAQPVPQVEMENIFVAIEDIDINEPITPQMIKLEPWPADRIPEGAIRDLEAVEARRPRSRLFAGEVIMEGKLFGSEEDRGAAKLIPKGYRVHSVRVTAESSASGLILPGDRVDVVVYLQLNNQGMRGSQRKQMTRTILTNCRVFAVNEQIHRETDAQGNTIAAKTVSLLVTPKQVEILVLAARLGSLSLSLRPPDEGGEVSGETDEATIAELLGLTENADPKDAPAEPRQPAMAATKKESSNSFLDFLKNQQAAITQPTSGTVTSGPAKPEWTMDLLSPDGVRRFEFGDDESLPAEVTAGSSSVSTMPSGLAPMPSPVPQTTPQPALPPGPVGSSSVGDLDHEGQDSMPAESDSDSVPADI